MNEHVTLRQLLKEPSAWIPLGMSFLALAFLLTYVAVFGVADRGDGEEGVPARIFQLIMTAQLPVIAYFALKWLWRRPHPAVLVLALQAVAWLIPVLTVIWLESL
jgi:hypothetical protein